MDPKSIIMRILALAALGLVLVYAQRFAGKLTAKAGV